MAKSIKFSITAMMNKLTSLNEELCKDIKKVTSIQYASETHWLDFEIRNTGYIYSILCYPMDNERNQTATPYYFLKQHDELGIIIPNNYINNTEEYNSELEMYCDKNQEKIIELIVGWFSEQWDMAYSKKFKLSARVTFIDKPASYTLKTNETNK